MDVCLLWVLCVLLGRGLYDELITPTEESLSNVWALVRFGPKRHTEKEEDQILEHMYIYVYDMWPIEIWMDDTASC